MVNMISEWRKNREVRPGARNRGERKCERGGRRTTRTVGSNGSIEGGRLAGTHTDTQTDTQIQTRLER